MRVVTKRINKDQSSQSKNDNKDKNSNGVQPKKSFFCYWVDILVAERNLRLGGGM